MERCYKGNNRFLAIIIIIMLIAVASVINWEKVNVVAVCILSGLIILLYREFTKEYMQHLKRKSVLMHRRYKVAIGAAGGAVWEWNERDNALFISSRMRDVLQTTSNIDTFDKLLEYVHKNDRARVRNFFEKVEEDRNLKEYTIEFILVSNDGHEMIMEVKGGLEIIEGVLWLTGIALDITDKRKKQEVILNREKRYRIALESTMDIMYYIDVEKKNIYLSKQIIGLEYRESNRALSIPLDIWAKDIVIQDRKVFYNKMQKLVNGETDFFNIEFRMENSSGGYIWISSRGKAVYEGEKLLIYGALRDISDSKEKEIKINFMNYYDETTGVPNRRYFTENVSEIIRISKELNEEVAIIFIDLDNFKYVNDTYGHQMGDMLLSEFCRMLYRELNSKSILARFGGDEFVIALREVDEIDDIKEFVTRLINSFVEPINLASKDIFCSISIGVSLLSKDGDTIDILLRKADMAMYKAKALGKNQYKLFDEEILTTINRQFDITEGLRTAIYKEEIYLMMQPKIRVSDERVVGYECLARWENELLGFVPPSEFIEVAENTGLIIELGKYLIKDAFKKCKELTTNSQVEAKLAINLSEVQLREDDIVEYIEEQLKICELDPKYIEFEITESVIMKSAKKNIETLLRLKELGFTLALDDFGTGYSSLNYLKILPIDVLKIDKSFIDDVCNDNKSEFIIEKIIELSHNFNLTVVAEGVETEEQLSYLRNKGCDIVQGYYYSKPVRYESIERDKLEKISN